MAQEQDRRQEQPKLIEPEVHKGRVDILTFRDIFMKDIHERTKRDHEPGSWNIRYRKQRQHEADAEVSDEIVECAVPIAGKQSSQPGS